MKKTIIAILLIFCTLPFLSGCNIFAQEPVPQGSIIMADEFTVDNGKWMTTVDADYSMVGYQADGLRFVINAPNKDYFSLYKTAYDHAILDVDASKLAGPDNNVMGIVCRYQDINNYYAFIISSDGYYGIVSRVNGVHRILPDGQLFFNEDVINTGTNINHIRVGCVQSALWLEVNNKNLMGLYDDALTEGKVGLIAGAMSEPGVDILFDNFVVIQP